MPGEGSRGGKVIGHTRSGKPIYDSHNHSGHKKFTDHDHSDAHAIHLHLADKKLKQQRSKKTSKEDKKKLRGEWDHHHAQIKEHGSKHKFRDGLNVYHPESGWNARTHVKKSIGDDMSEINKEIEEMADAMEKSANPHAGLFETIKKLGPEGIKEKLLAKSEDGTPLLNEQDRIVLKDALEEMKKAVSMDDTYHVGYHKGKVYQDTVIQEDKADDDADEKMVKPEAAEHNHQGDVTPEGREGQIIKSIEELEDFEKSLFGEKKSVEVQEWKPSTKSACQSQIRMLLQQLRDLRSDKWLVTDDTPEAKEVFEKEYSRIQSEIKKMAKRYNKMEKSIDIAKDAEETADEAVGKVKKNKKEDHKKQGEDKAMKKSNEDLLEEIKKSDDMMKTMISKMCKKGHSKKSIMDKCMSKGMDKDKVSSMIESAMKEHNKTMHDAGVKKTYGTMEKGSDMGGAKPNPEEGQVKDNLESLQTESTRGDKTRPEDLKVEEENKDAQDKVDDMAQGKMKKSVEWDGPNAILQHGKGGQNHQFSVNQYYDDALVKAEEANKPQEENLEKSKDESEEPKKMDINDIIEKSMDQSREANITDQMLKVRDEYVKPKFSKSFEDTDLYESMGISEEDAKKILGE